MEGYAVSAQCMALVRDKCLVPTKDAPELGYIKESSDKQYVPDVFYKVSYTYFFFIIITVAEFYFRQCAMPCVARDNDMIRLDISLSAS